MTSSADEPLFPSQNNLAPNENPASYENLDAGDIPVSVAIVVETSSRVETLLPAIRQTGILFTQGVMGADGEAAVIGYNDEVDRLLNFTNDDDAIEKAVDNIQAGTSGRHLYDALSEAIAMLNDQPSWRRHVIVVLAEPADKGSEETLNQITHQAQLGNIAIYSVGLSSTMADLRAPVQQTAPPSPTPPGIFAMPPMPGILNTPETQALQSGNINIGALVKLGKRATAPLRSDPLEIAALATGGEYQPTFRDRSIEPAIARIGDEMRPVNR